MFWIHPSLALKTSGAQLSLESAGVGAQDESQTDHTAKDPGMEMTIIQVTSNATEKDISYKAASVAGEC